MRASFDRSLFGWTSRGRTLVFLLASTSIWCLLAEFYGFCSMQWFAIWILLPATGLLCGIALLDRIRGTGELWHGVMIGAIAGLIAACAYDLFRLPFVFSREWGLSSMVPAMNLFKVFPRFGAMLLGEAIEQPTYSTAAHLLGWAYHFSNGATFGVMYTALVGDARARSWGWAIVMAMGLEAAMLATPYTRFFGIAPSALFMAVTLTAHLVFGVFLGLSARRFQPLRTTMSRSSVISSMA